MLSLPDRALPLTSKRYAIIADLHSNLEALKVVLRWIAQEGIEHIICLGDIVGYNANPVEVTYLTWNRANVTIKGNHDRYVLGFNAKGVREEKLDVIRWTRDQLSNDYLRWLGTLQDEQVYEDTFLLAHGSPRDPDEYLLTTPAISASLHVMQQKFLGLPICFFGHSHFPMVISTEGIESVFHETKTVKLRRDRTYLINPGSVGQPRDKCVRTSFGVLDADKWEFTVVRLDYDYKETARKVLAAGQHPSIAERLERGR